MLPGRFPSPARSVRIVPLTPAIGAELHGLNIGSMNAADFPAVRSAWLRHKVLFLPGQSLDLEGLERFSRRFGELVQLPYIRPVEGHPEVIRVLKEAHETDMGVFGGEWHSDFSFLPAPPSASILYSVETPPSGGDTLWVDMSLAWKRLPESDRRLLAGATAVHTGKPYGVSHAPEDSTRFKGSIVMERDNPEADRETRHPAVCRHPETGEQMLFVNPTYTTRIEGPDGDVGPRFLEKLYAHCVRPEFACRWRWQPGVVAIWDNRNTMHYAVNDYDGQRREMLRTAIRGEPPVAAPA